MKPEGGSNNTVIALGWGPRDRRFESGGSDSQHNRAEVQTAARLLWEQEAMLPEDTGVRLQGARLTTVVEGWSPMPG
jgi:hypothetical protein